MGSVLFYCEAEELDCHVSQTRFLDECSTCKKFLDQNDDVFMYQGIKAFCSEECRQHQIEIDNPPRRARKSSGQSWRPASSNVAGKSVRSGVVVAA